MTITATLSPTNRPGVYRGECGAYWHEAPSPEHGLARKLVAAGFDPSEPYQTQWAPDRPSMRWRTLKAAASQTVTEDDLGLHLRKYRPFSKAALAAIADYQGGMGDE